MKNTKVIEIDHDVHRVIVMNSLYIDEPPNRVLRRILKVDANIKSPRKLKKIVGGGNKRGRPVIVNGKRYNSGAEACRTLGLDVNGDSAIRVLKKNKIEFEFAN